MSLMGTLGKVAMGIMVAKTVGKAMGGSGGLGDMLGGLMGGKNNTASNQQQGGGLGDLIGSLAGGGSTSKQSSSNNNGLGDLLSAALAGNQVETTPSQEEQAEIILKAMINAAKADGSIDAQEQKKIVEHVGEVTQEEYAFVKNEMESPLDIDGVIARAKGIEKEVYMMSLLTINLDSQIEAQYMDKLGKGLGISEEMANEIHQRVGAPLLYR